MYNRQAPHTKKYLPFQSTFRHFCQCNPFSRPAFGNFRGDTVQSVQPTVKLCCLSNSLCYFMNFNPNKKIIMCSVPFFFLIRSGSILFCSVPPVSFRSLFCSVLYCVTHTSGNETFCLHLFRSNCDKRGGEGVFNNSKT